MNTTVKFIMNKLSTTELPIFRKITILTKYIREIIIKEISKDDKMTSGHQVLNILTYIIILIDKAYRENKDIKRKMKLIYQIFDKIKEIEIICKFWFECNIINSKRSIVLSKSFGEILEEMDKWILGMNKKLKRMESRN